MLARGDRILSRRGPGLLQPRPAVSPDGEEPRRGGLFERAAERQSPRRADNLYETIGTIYLAEGNLDKRDRMRFRREWT